MINAISSSIAMFLGVAQATCTLGSPQQVPRGRCHIGGTASSRTRGRYHEGRSESTSSPPPPLLSAKRSKPSQPKVVTCRYVAVTVRRGWERLGCWRKWRPSFPPLRPGTVVAAKSPRSIATTQPLFAAAPLSTRVHGWCSGLTTLGNKEPPVSLK